MVKMNERNKVIQTNAGVCYEYTMRNLQRPRNRDITLRILDLVGKLNASVRCENMGEILIESLGETLYSTAYSDEGGFFVQFRIAPLVRMRKDVGAAGQQFIADLKKMFPCALGHSHYVDFVLPTYWVFSCVTDVTSVPD
ncbi:MAG: hypothetical protein NUV49_00845 [Patescibacteria group bacterium]|nr:hypothetical protein [Patescibacteria group bacterium]